MSPLRFALLACLLMSLASAHPGGLDSSGGHVDKRTGKYHLHRSQAAAPKKATEPTQIRSQAPALQESSIDLRIQDYFRAANAGLAETPLGTVHERDVSEATKAQTIQRDHGRCVICGSTAALEVDHKVALMNGGTNAPENLATLCDSCHTKKTRMDSALRRHRAKLRR